MNVFLLQGLIENISYVFLGLLVVTIAVILYFVPIGLWITALFSGVRLSIFQLIGMRLRRVKPNLIVEELIKAKKASLADVKLGNLETHYLAKGNINSVVNALISARNAGIHLTFDLAAGIDLAGRDVLQAVRDSVNPKVIDSPKIEAVAGDGIQLIVMARITVRALVEKLVGGAGEETIVARLGQGIVSSIGSADSHEDILANPGRISDSITIKGLTVGTAYEVLSIDIADIDVGKSIGAKLRAEEAAAELQVARAKAEEKRAEAVAEEQYFKARVQEMRAKVVEAEAQVPMAIADAFRLGNLGLMDYHRLQNIEADTQMRRSFSDLEGSDVTLDEEFSIDENLDDEEQNKKGNKNDR
jgi:uncharacterized protein YqfA (UPF0365 family)